MRKEVTTEIGYKELEELIEKTYGREYCTVSGEEWYNDSSHRYALKMAKLDEHEIAELQVWRTQGTGKYLLRTILQDMVNNGNLDAGHYTVEVCW
jgi:hypothetical protein